MVKAFLVTSVYGQEYIAWTDSESSAEALLAKTFRTSFSAVRFEKADNLFSEEGFISKTEYEAFGV